MTTMNANLRRELSGWAGPQMAERVWSQICGQFPEFFLSHQTRPVGNKTVRGWEVFQKVTGKHPNLVPQPTGNCVAAGARDVIELTQCVEIAAGDAEEFHEIYDPFHYATGRELEGGGQLRGQAGSLGSWQAAAIKKYGVLTARTPKGVPPYTRKNVDDWGDGKDVAGYGTFRDYMEEARERVIKEAARVTTITQLREAVANYHFATIAAEFGYTMKPQGGARGFHRKGSERWAHQMSIWGIGPDWVAIKNSWGDVHGELEDLETGEPWPPGFIRAPLSDFEQHLKDAECFVFSRFNGFPEQNFDFGAWA